MGMFDKYDNIDPEYIPNNLPSPEEDKSVEINPHGVYDITGKLIGYTANTFDSDSIEVNIDDQLADLVKDIPDGQSLKEYLEQNYSFEFDIKNLRGEHVGVCDASVVTKDKGASLTKIKRLHKFLWELEFKYTDFEFANDWLLKRYTAGGKNPINIKYPRPSRWGGCSAVRCGDLFGRNYDWTYDNNAEFVVRIPSINGKHSSIGVASFAFNPDFNDDNVKDYFNEDKILENINKEEIYKIIPFITLDGTNDAGVTCNVNVCPSLDIQYLKDKEGKHLIHDFNIPFGIVFGEEDSEDIKRKDISLFTVCRYILDNASSALEACKLIAEGTRVHMPVIKGERQDMHYMIADNTETYLIEFITDQETGENKIRYSKYGEDDRLKKCKPIMTNFYLTYGVKESSEVNHARKCDVSLKFNDDGSLPIDSYSDEDQYKDGWDPYYDPKPAESYVTLHGQGLERFNLLNANYDYLSDIRRMKAILNSKSTEISPSIRYSNMYTAQGSRTSWKTEYVTIAESKSDIPFDNVKITDDPYESPSFNDWYPRVIATYENKQKHGIRPAPTWQTVHTSIYEISKHVLHLLVQEDDSWGWHEYRLSDNESSVIKNKDIIRLSFNVNDFKPLAPYDKIDKNEYSLSLKITYKGNDRKVYTKCVDNHRTLTIK